LTKHLRPGSFTITERSQDRRFPSVHGNGLRKTPITLPGVMYINEGPVVDLLTGDYTYVVICQEGKWIKIERNLIEQNQCQENS